MSKVIVIGAGIVGVSTAAWLLKDGHEVVLVDKQAPGEGTSFGNAGVLASASVVPVTVPGLAKKAPRLLFDPKEPLFLKWSYLPKIAPWLVKFLRNANPADTKRIAAALAEITRDSLAEHQSVAEGTPAARFIEPADYVFAYRDRAMFEGDAFGWEIRKSHGYDWEILEGDEVQAYDPLLSPSIRHLVRVPGHGYIKDPGAYVKALADHVVASGGTLLRGDVEDIVHVGGKVTGVRVDGETVACDVAILATGAWSAPIARRLGLTVPLESERGYHLEFYGVNAMPRSPTSVVAGKFVATPMEGRLRLAGIVEFGGLDAPPSRAPFELLEEKIRAAMPGLTWTERREWMGHRPSLTDSLPMIGEVPGIAGAFLGFGHQHVGLTCGPRTGRLLAQLVSGRKPNVDMSSFAPSRFTPGAQASG
ncbi:FAD-dependent oxidoreductase [Acuticoccus sp. M5D2P5]|uniref:NAD(P)/FAD-dependent oxidoreductase n=1 Tax=Acuticoccus kalidii TaxID=2910977 RepID=UPI001F3E07E3|nr:FAD-dependent oxidoreductase [Acuticoccus kalidii]MCF3933067.1 FAD-dependent oxidoreductase [Acuticoccus kalidii]